MIIFSASVGPFKLNALYSKKNEVRSVGKNASVLRFSTLGGDYT